MYKVICVLLLILASIPHAPADYQQELLVLSDEVELLTAGPDGWDDTRRFERYLQISLDQTMLSRPEFATQRGDPRGQGRWTDRSIEAIEQREKAHREGLALLESINRGALSAANQVNYDLLLNQMQTLVRGQVFPTEFLQMNQMGGPQQDPAWLLAMMPNTSVKQLENQLERLQAVPAAIDQSIALMRLGMAAGVTPPRITLRDVPNQIRNQLVDDPAKSPLLTGFLTIPDSVDSLQQAALREQAQRLFSEQVVPAYERLLAFTENEYLPAARESIAARDLPDGEAWYAHNVAVRTTTDLTPQQIHEIGLGEVKRIREEMNQVIAETGFTGSFADFLVFLRTDPQFYHTTAEGLLREYRDIAKRADPELMRLFGTLPRTPYGVIVVPSYAEQSQTTAYYQDPYSRFGQLTYEMWRAVRLVVDTGMHQLGWSRQQAIDYFKENAGKQEHDIIVEIDRYIVWPGQALAYKIGELKFKELRAYAEHELGEQFDIRSFHDRVLGNGAVPLDVLQANVVAWVAEQKAG